MLKNLKEISFVLNKYIYLYIYERRYKINIGEGHKTPL